MKRREFVTSSFFGALSLAATTEGADLSPARNRAQVVDAHCHAGPGVNYGKDGATEDPWTTFNAPEWTLRRMKEAGIDRTVIFPISNTSFAKRTRKSRRTCCRPIPRDGSIEHTNVRVTYWGKRADGLPACRSGASPMATVMP